MGWEQIKDYMNSLIGAALLLISIVLIPEIRAKKKYWITITMLVFLLVWLGIDKIKRDNTKEAEIIKKDSTFERKIDGLSNTIKNDSAERKAVYKKLESKFDIIIDSMGNPQKIKNFNTTIDQARDVYIGND